MKKKLPAILSMLSATVVVVLLLGAPLPLRADCTAFTLNNANIDTPDTGADPTVADNWTSYTRDSAVAHWTINTYTWAALGTRSQLIQVETTTAGSSAGIYNDITSVTSGSTYQIDVWQYPNAATATAEVRIATDGGTDFSAATSLWLDNTFAAKQMTGTVVAQSTSMRIWLDTAVSIANKACYWDAVAVTCIDSSTNQQPIHWATGDGTWDQVTQNWIDAGANACTFNTLDNVLFQDTDSGTSPITITLDSGVKPVSMSMTSTKAFIITGTGNGISGVGPLSHTGSGTLTLGGDTANTFGGDTTVGDDVTASVLRLDKSGGNAIGGSLTITTNGTVQITGSGGDQIGNAAAVTVNGLLDLNAQSEDIGALSGSGTIDTVAGGTVTLTVGASGAHTTWLGDIQNTAGTLNLTVVAPSGELQVGVAGGVGTLSYNGNTTVGTASDLRFDAGDVLPHGAGYGNWVINGRILSNGRTLTCNGLSGTGTLGADDTYTFCDWVIGDNNVSSTFEGVVSRGNAKSASVTKIGTGTLTLTAYNYVGRVSGGHDDAGAWVWGGTLVAANEGALGGYQAYVTNGATLQISNVAIINTCGVILYDGSTLKASGGTGASLNKGGYPYIPDAASTVTMATETAGDVLTINSDITGGDASSSITMAGLGTIVLNGANSYAGNVNITGGTLALGTNASLAGDVLTVGSGTTLDVTAAGYTVASGQTLQGTGTVNGNVTVASGGTVAPGTSIGDLTFTNGDLTLSGETSMEINKTAGTADKIVLSSGSLALGGHVTVTNLDGTLAVDDTFDLVDGTITSSTATFTLPVLPAGLGWDKSGLGAAGDGTIKVVTCDGSLTASAGTDQIICAGGSTGIGGSPTASGGVGPYTMSPQPIQRHRRRARRSILC